MSDDIYIRGLIGLGAVISLIAISAFCFKQYLKRFSPHYNSSSTSKKLKLVESLFLDHQTRLVLCQNNQDEYLILLGKDQNLLVSSKINASKKNHE